MLLLTGKFEDPCIWGVVTSWCKVDSVLEQLSNAARRDGCRELVEESASCVSYLSHEQLT